MQVNARDNEISAHKETIKAVNKGREQLQEELNAEIERLKADKEQVEVALQEDIENLEAQLKELNDFKSQKMGIEREIEELRANMVSMSDAHKSELEAQTQEYTAQRDKLRSDMLRRLKRTRDELFRLTDEQLHNKMHQTIKENEKLTLELEMYARESKQLLAANQQLATENASVKRSLDLQNSTTEELIRKSQTQQANIKQLTAKVKKLEASVESQKTVNAVDQSKRVVELNETVNRQYDLILELKTEVCSAHAWGVWWQLGVCRSRTLPGSIAGLPSFGCGRFVGRQQSPALLQNAPQAGHQSPPSGTSIPLYGSRLNLKTHTVSETENRTSCLTTLVRQSQSVAVSQTSAISVG